MLDIADCNTTCLSNFLNVFKRLCLQVGVFLVVWPLARVQTKTLVKGHSFHSVFIACPESFISLFEVTTAATKNA